MKTRGRRAVLRCSWIIVADYEAASAVFDHQQLADLTIAIGLINTYNRMAISFRETPAAANP